MRDLVSIPLRGERRGWAAFALLAMTVTALTALGALPRWPGAVHLVALPPLDLFADTRVLITRATGYPTFVAGLALSLTVRITVLALLLGGLDRTRLRLAATFYGAALVPALIAAQVNFVAHAVLYSRLFSASLALAVVLLVVMGAAPWTGRPGLGVALRSAAASGFRLPPLALYLAALMLLGAGAHALGPAGAVAAVPVSAALTLTAITWLSRAPAPRPLGSVVLAAVLMASGAGFVLSREDDPVEGGTDRPGSLLVMSGINSASGEGAIFEMDPRALGFGCDQTFYYSYEGPGDGQPRGEAFCPIRTGSPYEPQDTQRPFDEQVAFLVRQVEPLEPPVVVIGHSQAAWVAWAAAAGGELEGVDRIVLLGPFPDSPVGYPPPDEPGPGRVGGEGFRHLVIPLADLADFDFEVDAPLSRELLAEPNSVSGIFARPLPDTVDAFSVPATPDLALMPTGTTIAGADDGCPVRAAHPDLPLAPAFHRQAAGALDGAPPPFCPPWRPAILPLAQPFAVPPAWR